MFAFFGPYLNPKGFTPKIAILFLLTGLLATGTTEWMRELLRKPYVIYNYMYSNGLTKEMAPKIANDSFIASRPWISSCKDNDNKANGALIFRYQCMSCHTETGYRGIKKLIGERDKDAIVGFVKTLKEQDKDKNPYLGIMPPFVGDDHDIEALSEYLAGLNQKHSNNNKVSMQK
jgi:mono/diheme cytochrome c family protein